MLFYAFNKTYHIDEILPRSTTYNENASKLFSNSTYYDYS